MLKIGSPSAPVNRLTSLSEILRLEDQFHRAAEDHPRNPDVYFILGMIALRDGRMESALTSVDKALEVDATNPDYHHLRGLACEALGKADEALRSHREAFRLRPEHLDALLATAKILSDRGEPDPASELLERAIHAQPEQPEAYSRLGALRAAQGRLDAAAECYRQAIRFGVADAAAHKALAITNMRSGRLEQAVESFGLAIRINPSDAESYNDLGIVQARLGRLDEAIESYREAIRLSPEFADAHNNLGNALRNKGKLDEAIVSLQEALRLRPAYPEGHNNLGIALRRKGRHDKALASYQKALHQRPNYPEAHNNLGFALADRGRFEAAIQCYHQAIRIRNDYFEAFHNLGNALAELNRLDEAVAAYREALRLNPRDARSHKSLGIAFSRQEKFQEAEPCLKEAIRIKPDFHDAFNDLGIVYARQDRFQEAIDAYREAIRLRPTFAEAYNNLGNSYLNAGRFEESTECFQKALELRPNYADAHNNIGIAYAEMGRFDDAVRSYTECIKLRPNHVDAHMNRALTWLRKGDYAQGWAAYEWRWRKRSLTNRPLIQPQWNGFPLGNRTILLITEQGFGDVIQFIRYAALLKEQGATVIFEAPERLVPLLAGCPGVDQVVAQGQPIPNYDVFCPLLTVPGYLDTSIDRIPGNVPYIRPDASLLEKWGRELSAYPGFKVGINWQGNPKYAGERHRSMPLRQFEGLSKIPGVTLFSLQKNDGVEQLKALGDTFPVIDLGTKLDESTGPFMETAAVLKSLDLFITSDTAVAHLAGALGVPVWMPLSTTPDWRWLTGREDSPWYPTMRIFRQDTHMEWGPVFERIATELRKLAPAPKAGAVKVDVAPGELIDKLTILEIKAERIADPAKLRNVETELAVLRRSREATIPPSSDLYALASELRTINETLWKVEDDIRDCEHQGDFGPRFVELARAVYRTNDRRAAVKRSINELLRSDIVEEKSYVEWRKEPG